MLLIAFFIFCNVTIGACYGAAACEASTKKGRLLSLAQALSMERSTYGKVALGELTPEEIIGFLDPTKRITILHAAASSCPANPEEEKPENPENLHAALNCLSRIPEGFRGPFINLPDHQGKTALMRAIESYNIVAARLLLEYGADPTIADEDGAYPFHRAAAIDFELFKDLVAASSGLDDGDSVLLIQTAQGKTAAHFAIEGNNPAVLRFLLEAYPKDRYDTAHYPLKRLSALADECESTEIVEILDNSNK